MFEMFISPSQKMLFFRFTKNLSIHTKLKIRPKIQKIKFYNKFQIFTSKSQLRQKLLPKSKSKINTFPHKFKFNKFKISQQISISPKFVAKVKI